MGSGRSTPTSALPLAAALAAGGVVLAAAGYFGCSAYDRTISRRKAERLARPWLSKDAGNRIATVDSAAAALAAMISSSTSSSSSSSSSSRASALVVVANLSDKGLRSFELTELAGVTSADLSGNEGLDLATVDSLPPPPLSRLLLLLLPSPLWPSRPSLASLRSLGLSRCALRSVPRGLAGVCPNLSDLDLSHNELEGAFKGDLPKSLLRLNAQGNRKLTSVDGETLAPLPNLIFLGLKSCSLESLPGPALGKLTRLRELYVTDNRLRELPRELGLCTSLVKLQASFNLLESLPLAELAGLPRLEMLRAAACRISSLAGLGELLVAPSPSSSSSNKGKKVKDEGAGGPFRSLCWLSLAGNPVFDPCIPPPRAEAARVFALDEVLNRGSRGEELGSGASGDVVAVRFDVGGEGGGGMRIKSKSKGEGEGEEGSAVPTLAFKRFRGDAGPDGRAVDEVSVARAVSHAALASTVGTVVEAAAAAAVGEGGEGGSSSSSLSPVPSGLLLELIEGKPLADKPRGDPLLRCTWPAAAALPPSRPPPQSSSSSSDSDSKTSPHPNSNPASESLSSRRLSPAHALVAAARLASALAHLHVDLGCAHGDFYAHNILCDPRNGKATLVDFGAAFFYRRGGGQAQGRGEAEEGPPPPPPPSSAFEAFEQRAFGIFLRELAEHGIEETAQAGGGEGGGGGGGGRSRTPGLVSKARTALERAAAASADAPLGERPGFSVLARDLALAAREQCGYKGEELIC